MADVCLHNEDRMEDDQPNQLHDNSEGKGKEKEAPQLIVTENTKNPNTSTPTSTEMDPTCSICLCTFQDPRITPCSHVFCSSCLSSLHSSECPLCRQPLPSTKNSSFPIAWGVSQELLAQKKVEVVACECCEGPDPIKATIWCRDCSKVEDCPQHFCDSCADSEHQSKISRRHRRVPLSEKPPSPPLCSSHHQEANFFCCLERELICSGCLGDSHAGHRVVSVDKQAQAIRESLLTLIYTSSHEMVPLVLTISTQKSMEVRKEMIENEIEMLEAKLEGKKKERENLEKVLLQARERDDRHGEWVGVLQAEVEGMEKYDLVGKGGEEKVEIMRGRIEEGLTQVLSIKEKEVEVWFGALRRTLEGEIALLNKEQKEKEKEKKDVLAREKEEKDKIRQRRKEFQGLLEQRQTEEISQQDLDMLHSPSYIISLDVIKWELSARSSIQEVRSCYNFSLLFFFLS